MNNINNYIVEKLHLDQGTRIHFSKELLTRKDRPSACYAAAFILDHIEDAKTLLGLLNNTSKESVLYLWANALGEIDDDKYYKLNDFNEDELITKISKLTLNEFINTETPGDRENKNNP